MCSFFSMMELAWMLTTMQPMDLADEMARFRFSDFWKMFSGCALLMAISGTVPGTATLMNLLRESWGTRAGCRR